MLSVFALSMHLGIALGVVRPPSAGWSSTYQSMRRAMAIDSPNQITESLTYQESTGLVVLSNMMGDSNLTAAALTTGFNGRSAVFSGTTLPWQGSSGSNGTFGIVADPEDDTLVWAGESLFFPTPTSACSVGQYDTVTKQRVRGFDFSGLMNTATRCVANDIVFVGTSEGYDLYVTDFFGYRIYKADLQTNEVSVLNSDVSILCSAADPASCTGTSLNGPNGIALYTDADEKEHLLVAISPNRLVKVSLDTGVGSIVAPGPNSASNSLEYIDGIALYTPPSRDSRDSVLYVASGTEPNGAVLVLTSVDEWATFELRQVLNFSCNDFSATSIRIAAEHLMGLCNNNFAPDRSLINVLPKFASSVPIAKTIQYIDDYNLVPESFAYDYKRNMLVLGSRKIGVIRGFPYNNLDSAVLNYDISDAYTYIDPDTSGFSNSAGVHINPNNVFNDDCYGLICAADMSGAPALVLIDICRDVVVSKVVLQTASTGSSFANDLTVLDGKVFITDFYGHQIWSVDVNVNTFELSNSKVVLSATSCASNNATFCMYRPNGIASQTERGYIIISLYETGLAKYIPSSGSFTSVMDPTGLVFRFDGLAFSSDGMIAYGVRGAINRFPYETVMAFYSCSDWNNVTLLATFQTDCNASNPTINRLIPNGNGDDDLVFLCNNAFGPGPYSLQRIKNVNSIVTNQALSVTSCLESTEPTDETSSTSSSSLGGGAVAGIVIAVVVASAGIVFMGIYLKKKGLFGGDKKGLLKYSDNASGF